MVEWFDVLKFVKEYRRKAVFKDFTDEEILVALRDAFKVDGLAIIMERGKITALAAAFPRHECKLLHIYAILTTKADDLSYLIQEYLNKFRGYQITATRKGRIIYYNTPKLLAKLWTNAKAHKKEWPTS